MEYLLLAFWDGHDAREEHVKLCKVIIVAVFMKELQGLLLISHGAALEPDAIALGEGLTHQEVHQLYVVLKLLRLLRLGAETFRIKSELSHR